jgi:hypothetical protein
VRTLLRGYLSNAKPGNHSYSAFNMAVACYMSKENAECASWMQKVVEYEQKSNNWDGYAATVARQYLCNNEFDRCSLLFLLSENANESGNPEKSLTYLAEIEKLDKWIGMTKDDKQVGSKDCLEMSFPFFACFDICGIL